MHDEYNALVKNGTWILVPRPVGINLVRSMSLFKHKFHVDGTLTRYKARLVANGSSQQLASSTYLLQQVITSLHNEFDMTDLGALNYLLGISATRHSTGLFLSQKQYAIELLARAHMTNCNPSRTPVDTDSKLGPEGVLVQDPSLYCSLAGGLQYLTFTRPDISYTVQQIYLYKHDPHEPHLAALKCIICYIQGTLDFGFHLYSSTTISLVGYTDADWAGCPLTRRSTSGYYTNHIVIDIHFVRDLVTAGQVRVLHVPSRYQYADIFTKGLPSALFEDFRSSLSVRLPPA
uniref:Ribonuclease H-like domain-containing protein n=1 Tax=Tanacetum cinerariifolium TaxID=118510 RepID=A0A6L2JQC1_TANCI|nr:ribonuclease H-like domain-containing protein [Tanacetum cinerariifolium]